MLPFTVSTRLSSHVVRHPKSYRHSLSQPTFKSAITNWLNTVIVQLYSYNHTFTCETSTVNLYIYIYIYTMLFVASCSDELTSCTWKLTSEHVSLYIHRLWSISQELTFYRMPYWLLACTSGHRSPVIALQTSSRYTRSAWSLRSVASHSEANCAATAVTTQKSTAFCRSINRLPTRPEFVRQVGWKDKTSSNSQFSRIRRVARGKAGGLQVYQNETNCCLTLHTSCIRCRQYT